MTDVTEPQTAAEIGRSFAAPAVRQEGPVATRHDAAGSLLNFVAQAVENPNIDVAKLEALLRMQREIVADDAKAQFNRDFMELQAVLPRIKKSGVLEYPKDKTKPDGPKYKVASYARWEDLDREVRPILQAHGFSLSFTTQRTADGMTVIAILRHRAGHSTETAGPPLPCDASGGKNNIQGWGSAMSYGKRYAATAALNIIAEDEDDDGKRAGMRFITTEQVAELEQLIERTKTDRASYLQIMGVALLENIEAGAWAAARNIFKIKVKA